jgi:hypothetical protein
MHHDEFQWISRGNDGRAYDTDAAKLIGRSRRHLQRDGANYLEERLYRNEEGHWFLVEISAGEPKPHIVAVTNDKARQWCQVNGVSAEMMAEHFSVNADFRPSNELFDLLTRKWSTLLREEVP